MRTAEIVALLLAGAMCLSVTGCGAGLIGGVIAGSNNNNNPPPPPVGKPELNLTESRIPLMPSDDPATTARTLLVTNVELPPRASVQIRALGITVDQGAWVRISGQGNSILIGFQLRMEPFVSVLGDPTKRDVDGFLAVQLDGRDVAPPVAVKLLRQPVAVLEAPTPWFLSPLGSRPRLRVQSLKSPAAELRMSVTTTNPGGPGLQTRPCANLSLAQLSENTALVEADVPGNGFAGPAALFVDDPVAGRSTSVTSLYYRPEITLAVPAQGSTTGGALVTLIGLALAPLDYSTPTAPRPAFERVKLAFRKGGRTVLLPPEELRTGESALDHLKFRMPPSPDGRQGEVEIVLDVDIGGVNAQVVADRVFLFASPQPLFGPRGVVLDRRPVAVTPIALEGAPGGNDAPDFGVLYAEGGVGFLQLLMAEENGMFIRFGPTQRIGNPELPEERDPRDLVAADFDGDHIPDFMVANAGAATTATFHAVLGQEAPSPPIGAVRPTVGEPYTGRCRIGDFDEDGVPDLVVLPKPDAPAGTLPRLLLNTSQVGAPEFQIGSQVPVRPMAYDAMEVADLDGDGHLDIAVINGALLRLDVAYGSGTGDFDVHQLNFNVPGYDAHPNSPAVGLHAIGSGPNRSLAIVLAGLPPPQSNTPPVVAVLRQLQAREFSPPISPGTLTRPGLDPLGISLAANIDGVGDEELVVAVRGDTTQVPLLLLRYNGTAFSLIVNGVQSGAEELRSITSLHFGTAVPAAPGTSEEVKALFVVHESEADGFRERRLSTMLVFSDLKRGVLTLLAPDAGSPVNRPVQGLVAGNFSAISVAAGGAARDIALAVIDPQSTIREVRLGKNEGFGGFPSPGVTMREDEMVPQTLALVPAPPGIADSVAFFTQDGQVGLWQPNENGSPQQDPILSGTNQSGARRDLRLLAPNPALHTAPVAASSQLRIADVDGDGILDIVALMTFEALVIGDDDALLMVLRGKGNVPNNEFPFEVPEGPDAVTPVPGNASSIALGDFASEPAGAPVRLELALAIPSDIGPNPGNGDHVRFYRLVDGATPAGDSWRRSYAAGGAQVLVAGNQPTRLAAADFDHDNNVDLLVAAAGEGSLRLFLNSGLPGPDPLEVSIEAFHLTSPRPAVPGQPTFLHLGDINGDGNVDVLLTTESTTGELSTSVAFYLGDGSGGFDGPSFVPRNRLGEIPVHLAVDIGDFNADRVLDLTVAWDRFQAGDRNVRVLFGGSR